MKKPKKKDETKRLKNKLYEISHTYIRKRDSINDYEIGGYCIDCGTLTYGGQFQAGHFIPDGSGGALTRYHPHNMHGQSGGCNMKYNEAKAKIGYTIKMQKKYGQEEVDKLLKMSHKTIKADIIFFTRMIELYEKGNEQDIVDYIEKLYNGSI